MLRLTRTTLTAAAGLCLAAGSLAAQAEIRLTGAGATFPYPIYSKWTLDYTVVRPHIQITYASIGSGGGIRQFSDHTVDFGGTDGPDERLPDHRGGATTSSTSRRCWARWCRRTTSPGSAPS